MRFYKRDINLNNWNLATSKDFEISPNMIEGIMHLTNVVDYRIGFVVIGEQTYIGFEFKEPVDIEKHVNVYTNKVLSCQPDFNTTILSNGKDGALLYMQNLCWHIIRPSELKLSKGNIEFNCAIKARTKLIQDCQNNNITGILLPPEIALGNKQEYDYKDIKQIPISFEAS